MPLDDGAADGQPNPTARPVGAGVIAVGLYGFVATLQPAAHFGRILDAYGGVFVAGSLAWGMALDGFNPDRWDIAGALVCLVGVAIIMYAPPSSCTHRTTPDNATPDPTDRWHLLFTAIRSAAGCAKFPAAERAEFPASRHLLSRCSEDVVEMQPTL